MSLPWWQRRLCALDTETTAPDPETARIVQAAIAHVGGGAPAETRTWLVDPGVEIPAEAAAIHGITTERARAEGQPAHVAVPQFIAAMVDAVRAGELLVIMNAPYDLTVIAREAVRHGVVVEAHENAVVIDPKVLDKMADAYVGFHRTGSRKLSDLCAHYDAKIEGAHDAAHDAIAAARVAYRIGQRFPQLGDRNAHELHDMQRLAYLEQAKSLDAYWRNKGDPRRVDNFEWPVRTLRAQQEVA